MFVLSRRSVLSSWPSPPSNGLWIERKSEKSSPYLFCASQRDALLVCLLFMKNSTNELNTNERFAPMLLANGR